MKKTILACPALALLLLLAVFLGMPAPARAAFGLSSDANFYTVDTGAGLVVKIRRTDNGSNTQSPGDIASLVYNGVEYQDQTRGSQLNSGFDYLYNGVSAVTVSAAVVNTDYIKITVQAGNLTHYYMARNGYPNIYMGTYFTTEPDTLGLCRYIVRIPSTTLPNGPTPSDIRNTTTTVESSDIFGLPDGETRSKHYSNQRLIDWSYIGATGPNVGVWMARDSNEGNSGGPFYRCLLNQCGDDQEITYIINYGEAQTEAFRTGILNSYVLTFTNGAAPTLPIDNSWFANMGLTGYVPDSGRGRVTCVGIKGRNTNYTYTVGFANSAAQYWTTAWASNGYFSCAGMLPGTYAMTIYKNELAVWTGSVSVTAGGINALHTQTISNDPSAATPVWRIGDWDGTPREFLNGDKVTYMHPSDVRMGTWTPGTYTVGTSSPATGFPCYQWKDVNGAQAIQFTLNNAQVADSTVRIGLTTAYSGARPRITFNNWTSAIPNASSQPSTRTLTIGTYRGNNTLYTYSVPASALTAGTNTLTIYPISGSSGTGFLSPGYSIDCVDMLPPPAPTIATPASATPTPVTGTTTNLSVLGADAGGENTLSYTWSATGPAPVTFSPNGTNAAKNAVAAFTQAGAYTLTAAITDGSGQTVSSSIAVTVNQTPTTVTMSPAKASVPTGGTQPFTAIENDQFGSALSPQPSFTWAATGAGSVSATGLFTAGTSPGSASVTAADGSLVSAPVAVTVTASSPAKLASLVVSPTNMVGGQANATGTVTLTQAAATVTTVTLTNSNTSALTVPASVTIPAGASTATFTATSHTVTAAALAKVTAKLGTGFKAVNVYVNPMPAKLTSLTISPTNLVGGQANAVGTVTLQTAATTATTVTLTSGNPAALTVPASVTVAARAKTATFTATSQAVTTATFAKVTAKLGTGFKAVNVYVNPVPAVLYSLTLSPTSVKGGSANFTGTVTLKTAMVSATTITLASGNTPVLTVPASVTVAAGATTATFTATSQAVTTATLVRVSAHLNSGYKAVNVTVTH